MSASAGRVLIIPRGNYNQNTEYHMLDLVKFRNGSYVCKKTSKNNDPTNTEFWQLMAFDANVFIGTTAEWDALTTAEKTYYVTVIITDD